MTSRSFTLRPVAIASLLTLAAACSGRSCGPLPLGHASQVARLAKARGVDLAVTNCMDAFEGGFRMEGRFSCLAQLDPAQKKQVIDAFGLTERSRALHYYTPTQTHRCISRIDLPFSAERDAAWSSDVWAVENRPDITPGFDSVELHVAPWGEACVELTRAR